MALKPRECRSSGTRRMGADLIRYVIVVLCHCTGTYALAMLSLPEPDGKPSLHLYLRSRTQRLPPFFRFSVDSSVGLE